MVLGDDRRSHKVKFKFLKFLGTGLWFVRIFQFCFNWLLFSRDLTFHNSFLLSRWVFSMFCTLSSSRTASGVLDCMIKFVCEMLLHYLNLGRQLFGKFGIEYNIEVDKSHTE